MPKVCYFRPDRKFKRPFRSSDLERLIGYMLESEENPEKIIAISLIATQNANEWLQIAKVYRGLRIAGSLLAAWTAISRMRIILRAVIAIIKELQARMGEFPSLEPSINILSELGAIGKAVLGLVGGLFGVIRLLLTYDSSFVDRVTQELSELGWSDPAGDEIDEAMHNLLDDPINKGDSDGD